MNAKKELLEDLKSIGKEIKDIVAINISYGYYDKKKILMSNSLTEESLKLLDFEYDEEDVCQELFGTILFSDNTWMERGEYDGSEWWEFHKPTTIEDVLGTPPKGN